MDKTLYLRQLVLGPIIDALLKSDGSVRMVEVAQKEFPGETLVVVETSYATWNVVITADDKGTE